jgi:hypothetical protein
MKNDNSANGNNPVSDLKDSAKDLAEMQSEPVTIDLPDVKDIPGQENIVPASLGELADDTLASADEEGDELFDDDIDDETEDESDSDVSASEIEDLKETENDMPTEDDTNLHGAALDDSDEDGTPLNEGSSKNNLSGSDLDVPGADEDDEDEEVGEEDEENNEYSLGGDNHDDIPAEDF